MWFQGQWNSFQSLKVENTRWAQRLRWESVEKERKIKVKKTFGTFSGSDALFFFFRCLAWIFFYVL